MPGGQRDTAAAAKPAERGDSASGGDMSLRRQDTALAEQANHLRILHELSIALLAPSALEEILWVVARTAIARIGNR